MTDLTCPLCNSNLKLSVESKYGIFTKILSCYHKNLILISEIDYPAIWISNEDFIISYYKVNHFISNNNINLFINAIHRPQKYQDISPYSKDKILLSTSMHDSSIQSTINEIFDIFKSFNDIKLFL